MATDGIIELNDQDIYKLLFDKNVSYDHSSKARRVLDLLLEVNGECAIENIEDNIDETNLQNKEQFDVYKEKQKIRDYAAYANQQAREISRIENLKEIAIDMAKEFAKTMPLTNLYPNNDYVYSNKAGILLLSDWHLGLEIDNFLNTYNYNVFLDRINQLKIKVIDKIELHRLEKLYVINLGELLSGIIHSTIRLQNRQDLMQQIMIVSETLAELLSELSQYTKIEYHSVLDNHSRAVADKKQSLDNENFSILIDWFLHERLKNTGIKMCENEFDGDICTFKVFGWDYVAVHGHKDKVANVAQNLSLMIKRFYNAAFTAHLHHVHSDETHGIYVFGNGCLSGVDDLSKTLRKTSNPSQNMFIVSDDDFLEEICILKLK